MDTKGSGKEKRPSKKLLIGEIETLDKEKRFNLLSLTRRLHIINEGHKNNEWLKPTGVTLVGKKVCLVGFGDIGRCIARKLLAFKLDVWVSDPAFSKTYMDGLIKGEYNNPSIN